MASTIALGQAAGSAVLSCGHQPLPPCRSASGWPGSCLPGSRSRTCACIIGRALGSAVRGRRELCAEAVGQPPPPCTAAATTAQRCPDQHAPPSTVLLPCPQACTSKDCSSGGSQGGWPSTVAWLGRGAAPAVGAPPTVAKCSMPTLALPTPPRPTAVVP